MASAGNTNFYINQLTIFNTLRCNGFPTSPPDLFSSQHVIFAFTIATLLYFLQFMFQKKPESPFQTHPKTIWLAIGSLVMYCLSYDMKLRLRVSENHRSAANHFFRTSMAFFGALSVASLLSIIFPEHWICPVLLYVLAVLYTLSYLSGFLIQTIWSCWPAVTALLRRQQQQQQQSTSLGLTRPVSVQLHSIAEGDIIDQLNQLPELIV